MGFRLEIFRPGQNVGLSGDTIRANKSRLMEMRQNYRVPYVDRVAAAPDRLQILDRQTKMQLGLDDTGLKAEQLARTGRVAEAINLVSEKIPDEQSKYLNFLNVVVIAGEGRHISNAEKQYYFRQLTSMFKLYVDRELGDKASRRDLREKYNVDLALKMKKAKLEDEAIVEILDKDLELSKIEIMQILGVVDALNDPKQIAKAEREAKEQKFRDGF